MIIKDLGQYVPLLTEYAELRSQENRTLNIAYLQGNLVQNVKNSTAGISARVYKGGCWGFASTPELTGVKSVIEAATKNAVFLDSREKKGLGPFVPDKPVMEVSFGTKKPRLSQREIMGFTKDVDAYLASNYPNLTSRRINLQCLDMEKTLITSDGASLYSLLTRSIFAITLSLDRNGDPVEVFGLAGGRGHFEDNFSKPEDLYPLIHELYEPLGQ